MNKSIIRPICAATVTLGLGVLSIPTAVNAQSIFASCEEDLAKFCPSVTPGNGRLSACLYAHEDQVSPSCDAAIAETADLIDMLFERVRYAKQQCGADIAKLCGETEIGQGRLFSCLYEQKPALSVECLGVIENVQLPRD